MSEQVSTNSQQNLDYAVFPAISTSPNVKPRQFRTALPYPYYARLEVEAAKRGMSGYHFAAVLLQKVIDANFPVEKS